MLICDRIAKKIVARSQILKKCIVIGSICDISICDLSIEESLFVHDNEYSYANMTEDIDGFMFDVTRELNALGVFQLDKNSVKFRVENDLLVFIYDYIIVANDELMEKIRTSEWILEE